MVLGGCAAGAAAQDRNTTTTTIHSAAHTPTAAHAGMVGSCMRHVALSIVTGSWQGLCTMAPAQPPVPPVRAPPQRNALFSETSHMTVLRDENVYARPPRTAALAAKHPEQEGRRTAVPLGVSSSAPASPDHDARPVSLSRQASTSSLVSLAPETGDTSLLSLAPNPTLELTNRSACFASDTQVHGWHRADSAGRSWVVYDVRITLPSVRVRTDQGVVLPLQKRYSSFVTLVAALRKEAPLHASSLPLLPSRQAGLWHKFAPSFLETRRRGLQRWLAATLLDPRWGGTQAMQNWVLER